MITIISTTVQMKWCYAYTKKIIIQSYLFLISYRLRTHFFEMLSILPKDSYNLG